MRFMIVVISFLFFSSQNILAANPVIMTAPEDPPLVETWTLEEVWRIDGEDTDAPLLGVPTHGFTAPDGNFLLLDYQMSHVLVLTPEGEFVTTLSREGDGPGEIRRPSSIFMFSDSVIGILQGYPQKIVRLDLDGTPLTAIKPPDGFGYLHKAKASNGMIFISGQGWDSTNPSSSKKSNRNYLSRVSEDGETLQLFHEKTSVTDWNNPVHDEAKSYFPGQVWDLCADGTLLSAGRRDEYRIEFISPEGKILKVIERPFTAYKRTKEDLKDLAKGISYSRNGKTLEVETHFLPHDSAIQFIEVHDDGSIWVSSCYGKRDLPEGISRRYDVFESDGTFRSEVRIAYEYDDDRDGFSALTDGGFLHSRNIVSASNSMFKGMMPDGHEDEDLIDEDDVELSIIFLQAAK